MTSSAFRSWLADLAEVHALVPAEEVLARMPDGEGGGAGEGDGSGIADLTCEDVARDHDRTPACVRAWCRDGKIPGAYRLEGKEWRIPREGLRAFLDGQRAGAQPKRTKSRRRGGVTSLGGWREELG